MSQLLSHLQTWESSTEERGRIPAELFTRLFKVMAAKPPTCTIQRAEGRARQKPTLFPPGKLQFSKEPCEAGCSPLLVDSEGQDSQVRAPAMAL